MYTVKLFVIGKSLINGLDVRQCWPNKDKQEELEVTASMIEAFLREMMLLHTSSYEFAIYIALCG